METEIEKAGSDGTMKVRLINRKVHLLRCYTPKIGEIGLPDERADSSWWYQIVAVSDDCRYLSPKDVGAFVLLTDRGSIGNCWSVGKAERIVREDWLLKYTPFTLFMPEGK